MRIYNQTGQLFCTLVNEAQPPGVHQKNWDGKDDSGREATSGIYFCQIRAGKFSQSVKMVKLR